MQKKKAGWRYLAAATLAGVFLLSGIQANATENLITQEFNYPVREESLTPLSISQVWSIEGSSTLIG